jgi:hypothetical protein
VRWSVRRRLDLETIGTERSTMLRNPFGLRSDVFLGSGRRYFYVKCPHDALLATPRLLGFNMLLILTAIDLRGETENLLHAAGKLGGPTWWLLMNGRDIFYGRIVTLNPEALHFMSCDVERNGVRERSLANRYPSIFDELHDVRSKYRKLLLHHT